jgi:hypothetical protein
MVLPLSLRIADPETLIEVPMKSLEYWVRLDKEFCNYMYANREIEVMTY